MKRPQRPSIGASSANQSRRGSSSSEGNSTPSERLDKEFFNITLGVLGIIQGLTLGQISEKFAKGDKSILALGDISSCAHFLICFMLILRVFQTYISAVIDSGGWKLSFGDIVVVFAVGVVEFWVFDALGGGQSYEPSNLHYRIFIFLFAGSIMYSIALIRMKYFHAMKNNDPSYLEKQIRLQYFNIFLTSYSAALVFISYWFHFSQPSGAIISLAVACLAGLNINYSLKRTVSS